MKLLAIDGFSIACRSYYAIPRTKTEEGLHTNAIRGFLMTLAKLKRELSPDAICVAFDARKETFRHKADASYKATRKPMPEALLEQIPALKQVLDVLNIPHYELAGWEADDILGTISRICEKQEGWECIIATGDKDALQLITQKTHVALLTHKNSEANTRLMTEDLFREEYGFAPIHMIDLKSLMGDSSDNIAGVLGVGEKTAMTLIQTFGSIDAMYAAIPNVPAKPAAIKRLQEHEKDARHAHWLVTIVTDVPIEFSLDAALLREPADNAREVFQRFGFGNMVKAFGIH